LMKCLPQPTSASRRSSQQSSRIAESDKMDSCG
jgi:hypothetical protein